MAKLSAHGKVLHSAEVANTKYSAMEDGVILRQFRIGERLETPTLARPSFQTGAEAVAWVKQWAVRRTQDGQVRAATGVEALRSCKHCDKTLSVYAVRVSDGAPICWPDVGRRGYEVLPPADSQAQAREARDAGRIVARAYLNEDRKCHGCRQIFPMGVTEESGFKHSFCLACAIRLQVFAIGGDWLKCVECGHGFSGNAGQEATCGICLAGWVKGAKDEPRTRGEAARRYLHGGS